MIHRIKGKQNTKESNKHLMSQYVLSKHFNVLKQKQTNNKTNATKSSDDSTKKPLSLAKTTTTNTRNSHNEKNINQTKTKTVADYSIKKPKRNVSVDVNQCLKSELNENKSTKAKSIRTLEYSIKVKKLNMATTCSSNVASQLNHNTTSKKSNLIETISNDTTMINNIIKSNNKKSRNNHSNISFKSSVDKGNTSLSSKMRGTFNLEQVMKLYTTKCQSNMKNTNKTYASINCGKDTKVNGNYKQIYMRKPVRKSCDHSENIYKKKQNNNNTYYFLNEKLKKNSIIGWKL